MRKHINKIIRNPLFSGSAIMIIGSNSANGLNYLYHLIIGRLLGPSLYGELASLISVIGLLGIIPGAVTLVIVKEISSARNDDEISSLIKWFRSKVFISALIFSIIVLIFSPVISSFLHINKISYLLLISLSFFFSLQAVFNRSILQGLLKFREMVVTILAENAIKFLISILLILAGFAVNGALLAFVFAAFLGLYLTNFYITFDNKSNQKISPNLRYLLVLTIPVLIQSISTTSMYSSDVVLVKHFFSSHDAGIYASLSTLGKIIFFGAGPISGVMFPLVAKRNSRGENYRKVVVLSFAATALFAIAACIVFLTAPTFAINLLFGSAYLESEGLLIWFGVFMSLFTLASLLVSFGISLGKNNIVFFPFIFAILQIILIFYFHQSLLMVVQICVGVAALLLLSLLIYLIFERGIVYGKEASKRDKFDFNNRTSF